MLGRLVLLFVALTAGAQSFAVKAWVQTASISFTKTYAFINRSTAPGCGPELLHSTLLGTLQLVAGLSSRGQMGLAAELAGCCRWAVSSMCPAGPPRPAAGSASGAGYGASAALGARGCHAPQQQVGPLRLGRPHNE